MRLLLAGVLLVAGCATPPPQVVTVKEPVEVKIPVPVPCVVSDIPKPSWAMDNPDLRSADVFALGLAALQELEQRRSYEVELEAVISACKKVP